MIHRRLLTPLALVTGAAITAAAVALSLFSALDREKDDFRSQVQQVRDILSDRINSADEAIYGVASLFNASTSVEADEFRISSEEILRRHPFIDTVAYFPLVTADGRAAFEQQMRDQGYVSFSITDRRQDKYQIASARERYFSAVYIEPLGPLTASELGFDALSEPAYQNAIRTAIESGKAVASYVTGPQGKQEYMLFKALYAGKDTPGEARERIAAVNGLLGARVNIQNVMQDIMTDQMHITLQLDRGRDLSAAFVMKDPKRREHQAVTLTQLTVRQQLTLPGQRAAFTVTKDIHWHAVNHILLIASALAGIAIAVLIYALARVIVKRADELERRNETIAQQVAEQTRALDLARRYLENIVGSMADALFVLDPGYHIQRINGASTDLLGYDSDELAGQSMQTLFTDTVEVEEVCGALLRADVVRNSEVRLRQKSGDTVPVSLSAAVMRDSAGAVIGTVVAAQDISARVRAQAALAAKNAEMERINTQLDQFAYVISHDLKAPLRAIENLSQWIEDDFGDNLNDDVRKNMALMRSRVRRMDALITGVLAYSRAGRVDMEIVDVDVGEMLKDIKDSMPIPPGLSINVGPGMPHFQTSAVPLNQVFSNLISNAIKYRSRDNGHIEVTVREAGEFYEFAVSDDGPGIAPEHHERIFGIFQTLDANRNDSTGVGLALVKKIVESQGGTITIESALGAGTTFRFTWPMHSLAQGVAA